MSFFSNFTIVRRILFILIGLAITGYMAFVLYSNYRSQSELHNYYLGRLLQDTEKRATAVSYFFAERSNDMVMLAESRELSVYFENLALGMSMEYGLSASLMDAEDSMKKFRAKRELAGNKIYSRILFLDSSGKKLIDTGEAGVTHNGKEKGQWKKYLLKKGKNPVFFAEGHNSDALITISLPYLFKGSYAGQIVARVSPELIYRQFIKVSDTHGLGSEIALLYRERFLYDLGNISGAIPFDQFPKPIKLREKDRFRFPVAVKNLGTRMINAYYTEIKGVPFALVTFVPENKQTLLNSPKWLIVITGSIGIMILIGAFIIIRTTLGNAILNTRLTEISIRERAIAEKNRILKKLTAALEQSANSVVITEPDGIIEYVNPFFTQLTGYERQEVIGKHLGALTTETEFEEIHRMMLQAVSSGEQWSGELPMIKKNGELYWEFASISPVKNDDGEIISCVAIAQDVTEIKLADEKILKLNTELEQRVRDRTADLETSNQDLGKALHELKATQSVMLQQEKMASIGQLAAGVAHEINNPIGFMLGNLSSLKKYVEKLINFSKFQSDISKDLMGSSTTEPEKLLESISNEKKALKIDFVVKDIGPLIEETIDGGERVKKIVQNLKSFSHLDGTGEQAVNLNEQLDSTINIAWNELKYKATLKKEYGEIPETTCNGGQINQVFLNMLVNAAQSIEETGEITVRTWHDRENICVSIADTGCGIPSEKLNRIFEPFFTTKEVGKGTGLGLSISYDIIKQHGGKITVESEISKGTTFTINLPVR